MLEKFKTKELVFIALLAALMFVIAILLGLFLTVSTGIPLLGGILVNWFLAFSLVLLALIIRKFGTLTLAVLIYSLLSMPTSNMGPPGVYKVIVGVALGLIIDLFLSIGKYKRWVYYVGAGVSYLVVPLVMFYSMKMLGMPEAEKLAPLMVIMMVLGFFEALLGCWLACLIYDNRLKKNKLIRQLQS